MLEMGLEGTTERKQRERGREQIFLGADTATRRFGETAEFSTSLVHKVLV